MLGDPTEAYWNNSTEQNISCNKTINPWCGEFGALQVVEVTFLTIINILGVGGNLLVIFSIIYEKKVHVNGNSFIINLAVADFIITGIYTPTVIANVLAGDRALILVACQAFGYLIVVGCSTSMWNLAFIALNRYWAVVHNNSYKKIFSKINVYIMMSFAWIWSNLLALPTLTGWSDLIYDYKSMVCSWDDTKSRVYNMLLMVGAILIPLSSTIFCYSKLFRFVRDRRRKLVKYSSEACSSETNLKKRHLQREISLLKTLATTVVVFVLCWTPYSLCILIDPINVEPHAKKVFTWLGLCNSAVNFIIYGVMNRGFRKGYKNLLNYIFPCLSFSKEDNSQSNSNGQNNLKLRISIPVLRQSNSTLNQSTLPSLS